MRRLRRATRFQTVVMAVATLLQPSPAVEWFSGLVYHGTSLESARAIKEDGYQPFARRGRGRVLGYGLNFTQHAESARLWALGSGALAAIVKVRVAGRFADLRGDGPHRLRALASQMLEPDDWHRYWMGLGIEGLLCPEQWFSSNCGWCGILYNANRATVIDYRHTELPESLNANVTTVKTFACHNMSCEFHATRAREDLRPLTDW